MPHSAAKLTKACTKGCMTNSKIAIYVGFAQRSGAVLYGEDRIRENLSKCRVVLVDGAASEKYRTRLQSVCKTVLTSKRKDLRTQRTVITSKPWGLPIRHLPRR